MRKLPLSIFLEVHQFKLIILLVKQKRETKSASLFFSDLKPKSIYMSESLFFRLFKILVMLIDFSRSISIYFDFICDNYSQIISTLGLLVTIVGVIIAYIQLKKTK